MVTLEERLLELERILFVMQAEHISDIKQLGERIDILQQQITEQRRRMSEQEQSIFQRFDSLENTLSQRFSTIDQRFDSLENVLSRQFATMDQRFAAIDQNLTQLVQGLLRLEQQNTQLTQSFSRLEQQSRQHTDEIKAKFEANDHFATRTWGVVNAQQSDIRTTKEHVQSVLSHLDAQDQVLNLILERLPEPGK